MRKKKIIIFSILFLFLIIIVPKYFIPKNIDGIAHFVNQNSIEVNTDEKLNRELIKIELSISGTDYNKVEIFNENSEYKIPKGYGENDWNLSYDGKYFETFRHFKTNNWHDHNYSFYFYQNEDGIKCDVKIDGPDKKNITINLIEKGITAIGFE